MTDVLVVDDEESILRTLRISLTARGYGVHLASDGTSGVRSALSLRPDIMILDLGLPDMDGVAVIREIRRSSQLPIIVLSAREREADKVAALDAGADDFVTKPFGMAELLARLRAAARRLSQQEPAGVVLTTAHFTVDLAATRVTSSSGAEIHLTPTEWSLLALLVRNHGRLVTGKRLLKEVWGEQYGSETHYLRVYLAQLRRKLEPEPSRPKYLITESGMGYRLVLGADDKVVEA